jgi:hypothetical protein
VENQTAIGPELAKIRKRRMFLMALILVYLPATLATLNLTHSIKATGVVFAVWFVLLCIAVTLTAVVRCPQCQNTFHMRESTLRYSRKCSHCGLHIHADKTDQQ